MAKLTGDDPLAPSSDTPSDERVKCGPCDGTGAELGPNIGHPCRWCAGAGSIVLDAPLPTPSPSVPEASGRPKWEPLTLREAAIEAILIREQDTAFSTVARIIAALPAPSSSPVGDRGLDVRLYGMPDDEQLDCDPDEAVQSYLDGYCGEFPVTITIEEHDTYPPRAHFPGADYAAEWSAEWAADNDTDEGFGDQAMDAAKDPEVVAAFEAAIDMLASKITYRMADKVTASYEVTITDESTWTYDPEFVSLAAAADRGEPTP